MCLISAQVGSQLNTWIVGTHSSGPYKFCIRVLSKCFSSKKICLIKGNRKSHSPGRDLLYEYSLYIDEAEVIVVNADNWL